MKKLVFSLLGTVALGVTALADPTVDFLLTSGLVEPYGVVVDNNNFVYITDAADQRVFQYNSENGQLTSIAGLSGQSGVQTTNVPGFAATFNSPKGIVATRGGLVVADSANHVLRFLKNEVVSFNGSTGSVYIVSILAGVPQTNGSADGAALSAQFNGPSGLAADSAGNIYIADSKNKAVRKLDVNNVVTTVTASTIWVEPTGLALGDTGEIYVSDSRNHAIYVIRNGVVRLLAGNPGNSGATDSIFADQALFNSPAGLIFLGGANGLIVCDSANHTLRRIYQDPVIADYSAQHPELGHNGYSVQTYAGIPQQPGFQNGTLLSAQFNSPQSISKDGFGGLFITDVGNRAVRRIQTAPPLPRVNKPRIGTVIVVTDETTGKQTLRLSATSDALFNNDVVIAISAESATETFFTFGPTPSLFEPDTIPIPNSTNSLSPPSFLEGSSPDDMPPSMLSARPDVTVKAVSTGSGRRPSELVTARFQFKVAPPVIIGDNPASFQVLNATTNVEMWYTLDGNDPTNQLPSLGPISNGTQIKLQITNEVTFRIRGFRPGYQNSKVSTKVFKPNDYQANRISFGFANGEGSSKFRAVPGQRFYAPVTLSLLPGASMYSLQFNLQVAATNLNATPGTPVSPGAMEFSSMLLNEVPAGSGQYFTISNTFVSSVNPTNLLPVAYTNSTFTNTTVNLLGVGWFQRKSQLAPFFTNANFVVNSQFQDLISFSQARDTLFKSINGKVILGAFAFDVPGSASTSDVYQIKIGRPSATILGVGSPGDDIFIDSPTNGSLEFGPINGIKNVQVVDQIKYIVGDAAPFGWLNAGDFGDSYLLNDDVMQVFETAVYLLNATPANSDFSDALDSCCRIGVQSPDGIYTQSSTTSANFFDGDDAVINTIAFGDGFLDVNDVFVTFRRSLVPAPTLIWFERYWTNGVLVADTNVLNNFRGNAQADMPAEEIVPGFADLPAGEMLAGPPSVGFSAENQVAAAGREVSIPITANIVGPHPLRVLMLSLRVEPLDDSPWLEAPIRFTPAPGIGQPTLTSSKEINSYAAAWLNNRIPGLLGTTVLGTLTFTIPESAALNAAYAIRFDHGSASPNGFSPFPHQNQDALISLSDRSGSSWGDGIPDEWRLLYFGTISQSNLNAAAGADPDGDGMSNLAEFKAGTNPVKSDSKLTVSAAHGQHGPVLRWMSKAGKRYIVESTPNLNAAAWTTVAGSVLGNGALVEAEAGDSSNKAKFYRIRIAE